MYFFSRDGIHVDELQTKLDIFKARFDRALSNLV